jgi:N-hydroxyarylamine O-acetyltransferase
MDITSYLTRIDYNGSLEPTPAALRSLHQAHLLAVPFENLDIHQGKPILLDEAGLFEKIVVHRRGGFCYELNGLFAALLRELGFKVDLLSARVYENGEYGPEFDHLVLRVRLEEDWLADVGFGDSFREPLLLNRLGEQVQSSVSYQLQHRSPDVELLRKGKSGRWYKNYRFSLQPRLLSDFDQMCRYHQTSPNSHFTQKRICSRATLEGRVSLSDLRLITTINGRRSERILDDEKEFTAALYKYFGIRLP